MLSPILFALYLADLGRELECSNLGIQIGNIVTPGVFFADDMCFWGTRQSLTQILQLVADYGAAWKIEFSGPKSVVIPIKETKNRRERQLPWPLGIPPHADKQAEVVIVTEVDEGKYLGITIHKHEDIYKSHKKMVLLRLARLSGFLHLISNKLVNPLTIVPRLWKTYAVSAALYGAEVITYSNNNIMQLERQQKAHLRGALKLPHYVANAALYKLTGTTSLRVEIDKWKLNFYYYIKNLPHSRWSFQALQEQITWGTKPDFLFWNEHAEIDNIEIIKNNTKAPF